MSCKPQLLLNHQRGKPKVSVILIDWGVRESFHSLHYLNRQTADRGDYELIWLEFYDRQPKGLHRMVAEGRGGPPILDKWLVLGYAGDHLFHKHRLYNVGLLAAAGEVCVICDSDAVFRPTFIANMIAAFEETPNAVVHVDQVRNEDPRFYPFNYPTMEEILGPGCINWHEVTTRGLEFEIDRLHKANYGDCMAARRRDLLAIGGADEHVDYLGYICGPYEMTFRLINYGRRERWLRNEYLYHLWHPNQSGINTDYQGPHDGRFMSLRALDARARFRIAPYARNPWLSRMHPGKRMRLDQLLTRLERREEPAWKSDAQPGVAGAETYWVERDYHGYNLFFAAGTWYALPESEPPFALTSAQRVAERAVLQGKTQQELEGQIQAVSAGAEKARPGVLQTLVRRFRAQPLHCLPGRGWRKACKLASSLREPRSPWKKQDRPGASADSTALPAPVRS